VGTHKGYPYDERNNQTVGANPSWLPKINTAKWAGTHEGHPYNEHNKQIVGAIPCGCPKQNKGEKMKKTLIALIALASLANADFTRSGSIVTDSVTELQWQDDVTPSTTWQAAITYCENLTLDSYDDWRLPNLNELKSLVDRTTYDPAIQSAFQNVVSSGYWSSTAHADGIPYVWGVDFNDGSDYWDIYELNSHYVRCVRLGD